MPFALQSFITTEIYGERFPSRKKAEEAALRVHRQWKAEVAKMTHKPSTTVNVVHLSTNKRVRLVSQVWDGVIEPFEGDC